MRFAVPADTRYPKSARATPLLHREAAMGLLYLTRWPALPAQLTERDRLVHRLCTLLSSRPRAPHLIHLLVQAPKDDVQAALRTLLQSGCIHIGRTATAPCSASRPQAARASAPAATPNEAASSARPSATIAPLAAVSPRSPAPPTTPVAPVVPVASITRWGRLWSRLST